MTKKWRNRRSPPPFGGTRGAFNIRHDVDRQDRTEHRRPKSNTNLFEPGGGGGGGGEGWWWWEEWGEGRIFAFLFHPGRWEKIQMCVMCCNVLEVLRVRPRDRQLAGEKKGHSTLLHPTHCLPRKRHIVYFPHSAETALT